MEEYRKEICFGCGKEGYFILLSPMRCTDCVKNKIPIATSPVSNSYWEITTNEQGQNNE